MKIYEMVRMIKKGHKMIKIRNNFKMTNKNVFRQENIFKEVRFFFEILILIIQNVSLTMQTSFRTFKR